MKFSEHHSTRSTNVPVLCALTFLVIAPGLGTAAPIFMITNFSRSPFGSKVEWSAETNAFTNFFFQVESAPAIPSSFIPISPPILEGSSLTFTDPVSTTISAFYRVAASPAFTSLNQPGAFSAYPATNVNGLSTAGFAGAVFDGRYVYFVPYQSGAGAHGRVLRL